MLDLIDNHNMLSPGLSTKFHCKNIFLPKKVSRHWRLLFLADNSSISNIHDTKLDSVIKGFVTATKTELSRRFQWYLLTYIYVSFRSASSIIAYLGLNSHKGCGGVTLELFWCAVLLALSKNLLGNHHRFERGGVESP